VFSSGGLSVVVGANRVVPESVLGIVVALLELESGVRVGPRKKWE